MDDQEKENFRALGRKYLNEKGQCDLEADLQDDKLSAVRHYLLGAVDGLWNKQKITDDEAREAYQQIGMPPEKAADVRQGSSLWK